MEGVPEEEDCATEYGPVEDNAAIEEGNAVGVDTPIGPCVESDTPVEDTPKELGLDTVEDPMKELTVELGAAEEGVADAVEPDLVFDDAEDSGPVYIDDEIVDPVDPIARGIVSVLASGLTDERLVVYDELG